MRYKRFLLCGLFFVLFASILQADPGQTINFSMNDVSLKQINGYDAVDVNGCYFRTEVVGGPDLPVKKISFLIPKDKEVKYIKIESQTTEEFPGEFCIIPTQLPLIPDGSPPPPFVEPDPRYYNDDLPYPLSPIKVINSGYRSGFHIVTLSFSPVVYYPLYGQLYLYTEFTFSLMLESSDNIAVPVKRRSGNFCKQGTFLRKNSRNRLSKENVTPRWQL